MEMELRFLSRHHVQCPGDVTLVPLIPVSSMLLEMAFATSFKMKFTAVCVTSCC